MIADWTNAKAKAIIVIVLYIFKKLYKMEIRIERFIAKADNASVSKKNLLLKWIKANKMKVKAQETC
jgi:hypothetical protein